MRQIISTARHGHFALLLFVALTILMAACGGGGGGGGSNGPAARPAQRTTFTGNLASTAALSTGPDDAALAAAAVQVCVEGTSFCTEVDDTGAFTLAADVGGDVVLLFEGPGFSARLALNDVPRGATVRIVDIVCSTINGQCHAASVEVVNPLNTPPVCAAAVAQPALLWPPNHQMVAIAIKGSSILMAIRSWSGRPMSPRTNLTMPPDRATPRLMRSSFR